MKRSMLLNLLLVSAVCAILPLSAAAQEASVKPGINQRILDRGIEGNVKSFEREGRDVVEKLDAIVAACKLQPEMDVADVGAGTGLFTRPFAVKVAPGGTVYAVEISEKFTRHIEKTCREAGIDNVVGVVGTATSTELKPDSVDLVFVCDTYHHFEYPYKMLASIHQALRPGGRLVIVEFKKEEGVSPEWIMGHVRADQATTTQEITEAGFKLIDELDLLKTQYVLRFEKVGLGEKEE